MTCVQIDVPASFAVSAAAVVSVKGQTQAHGWRPISGRSAAARPRSRSKTHPTRIHWWGCRWAIRRSSDHGDSQCRGRIDLDGTRLRQAGAGGDLKCGSGNFPTESIVIGAALPSGATPTPVPTPTPAYAQAGTADSDTATRRRRPPRRRHRHRRPQPISPPAATSAATPTSTVSPVATAQPPNSPPPAGSGTASEPPTTGRASAAPTQAPDDQVAEVDRPAATAGTGSSASPRWPLVRSRSVGQAMAPGAPACPDELDGAVSAAFSSSASSARAVPAVVMGVPGLLVVLVVLLQLAGAGAWASVGRRWLSRLDRRPVAGAIGSGRVAPTAPDPHGGALASSIGHRRRVGPRASR